MADEMIKVGTKSSKSASPKKTPATKAVSAKPVAATKAPKAITPPVSGPSPVPAALAASPQPVLAATPAAVAAASAPVLEYPVLDNPIVETVTTPQPETPAAAPAPVATTLHKEANIMENTVNTAAEKAQTLFVDMNDRAKAALEKTQGMFADMTEFNKGNVEALVESSKIAAKGIETMGQEAAEYTRKSFESMTAIVKSLGTIKSPTEFMKLHSDYVRTSFDSLVAESSKNTEAMLKLAGEIAQPISNRVAVAAEKMKISA